MPNIITVTSAPLPGNTGDGTMTLADPAYLAGVQTGVYPVRITDDTPRVASSVAGGGNVGDGTLDSLTVDPSSDIGDWTVVCDAPATFTAGANTGDGTIINLSTDPGAIVGVWLLECIVAIPAGGTFSVTDPNGDPESPADADTPYDSDDGLLHFEITAGAIDYVEGDTFTITVSDPGTVFTVTKPDTTVDGQATVGTPYDSAVGPNFTLTAGGTAFVEGDNFTVTVAAGPFPFSVTDPAAAGLPDGATGVAYTTQIAFTVNQGATLFIIGDGFDVTVLESADTSIRLGTLPDPYGMTWADWSDTVLGFSPSLRNRVSSDTDWQGFAHSMAQYVPNTPQPEAFSDWQGWAQALRWAIRGTIT